MAIIDLTSGGSATYVFGPQAPANLLPVADATALLITRLEAATEMAVVAITPTAAEVRGRAIQLARAATRRNNVVACRGTAVEPGERLISHGDTLQALRAIKEENAAAFLIEIIQTSHNTCVPPPHYSQRIRAGCDEAGTLLVSHETSGLARTGALFATEREKITADLIALPLAVAVGVDGGCVLARRDLGIVPALGVMTAAPAALTVLETIERDRLINHVKQLGKQLDQLVHGLIETRRTWAMDTRGRGLLRSLTLWDDPQLVVNAARARGLTIGRTGENGLLFAPPLTTTAADLAETFQVLDEVLVTLTS